MRKIAVVGLSLLAAFGIACGVDKPTTQGPGIDATTDGSAGGGGRTILFEVLGEGVETAGNISYGVGGNMSQANGVALPWSKEATSNDGFLITSLVAQSGSRQGGKITCRITVDGKVVVENSSEGAFAVVSCSG